MKGKTKDVFVASYVLMLSFIFTTLSASIMIESLKSISISYKFYIMLRLITPVTRNSLFTSSSGISNSG